MVDKPVKMQSGLVVPILNFGDILQPMYSFHFQEWSYLEKRLFPSIMPWIAIRKSQDIADYSNCFGQNHLWRIDKFLIAEC